MLYRYCPGRTAKEELEFIRRFDKSGRAFGKWTNTELYIELARAITFNRILYSENSQGELNGICVGRDVDPNRMRIVGIVTSEPNVFREMLTYWKTNFPLWTIETKIRGKEKTLEFTSPMNIEQQRALFDICFDKAKQIVSNVKASYPGAEGLQCGGDPPAPTTNESMASILEAYKANLPGLSNVIQQELLPMAQAQQNASAIINPQQAALQAELYAKYGPQLNQIGNQIAQQNAMSQATSDLNVLKGPGQELIKQGIEAQKLADPEFYTARAQTGDAVSKLLSSIDLSGLSGGERAEVERSLNRDNVARGTNATPTATSTVANAMTFGNALNNKRAQMNQAIQTATGFMGGAKSGVDPFQVATGRSSNNNTGESKFTGVQDVSQAGLNFGNNVLNQAGQMQQTAMGINANRRDSLDRFNQTFQGTVGSICCFNFFEALDGPLPRFVREERDRYYKEEPIVAKGYLWMSKWLVPLMQKSPLIKTLVQELMVYPIIQRGGWLKCVDGYRHGWIYESTWRSWKAIWKFCGKHFAH